MPGDLLIVDKVKANANPCEHQVGAPWNLVRTTEIEIFNPGDDYVYYPRGEGNNMCM